jgi:ubiquinone biosynthesis accessory factor UbiK
MKPKFIDELSQKICEVLPESLQGIKEDTGEHVKSLLNATFDKMHLVTREEFEVQTKVLARTRQRLEELEVMVKALEQQLDNDEVN